jgi:hypothetical protein
LAEVLEIPGFLMRTPANLRALFAFSKFCCHCHQQRLTYKVILDNFGLKYDEWFGEMFASMDGNWKAGWLQKKRKYKRICC